MPTNIRTAIVTAELCEDGLIRVYEVQELTGRMDELRRQIGLLDPAARAAERAVLADRYRTLTLYADGRLQLTKEVAWWLKLYPFPSKTAQLFGEAFPTGMS